MAITIRRAGAADLPDITRIYNEAGVGSTASYDLEPVSLVNREQWFATLTARDQPVLVAVEDGVVLGYANYGNFRDKAGYAHTVEHTVYVGEGHRASGCGRMLMTALIDHARGHGVHVMIGVVDAENADSLAFHARLGFVEAGRLSEVGHKFGRWLDVVIMQLNFG